MTAAHAQPLQHDEPWQLDSIASLAERARWDQAKALGAVRVSDRDRSAYLPEGIRWGNFFVFPSVSLYSAYDDNMYSSPQHREGGWRVETTPVLRIKSSLPRHMLDMMIGARAVTFPGHEDQDYVDGIIEARARIDIDHAHAINARVLSHYRHEERSSDESPLTARGPVPVWQNKAEVVAVRNAGRLSAAFGLSAESFEYSNVRARDGSLLNQQARDLETYRSFMRFDYRFSPGYALFGRLEGNIQENRGDGVIDRDARGGQAMIGLNFELGPLIRGYGEIGYVHTNFVQPNLKDLDSIAFGGKLEWLVSPLMTISLIANRSASPTSYGEASARIDTSFGARLDYEALRNLIVHVQARHTWADFVGSDRHDSYWAFGGGIEYFHTKNWVFTLNYEHQVRESTAVDYDSTRNIISAGVKVRF